MNGKQAKLLSTIYILSTFNYCPLMWMFCSKIANKYISRLQRTVCIAHDFETKELDELLIIDNSKSIHTKNLQYLLIEIYKSLNDSKPSFMWSLFLKKEAQYNLRISNLLSLQETQTPSNSGRFWLGIIFPGYLRRPKL